MLEPKPACGKRRAAAVSIAVALVACSAPGRFVIKVEESEIQRQVNERFPITHDAVIFKVAIARPAVHLNATSNRVELGLEVVGSIGGQEIARATARVSGGVRYLEEGTVFVLTDPRVEQLVLSHAPRRFEDRMRAALNQVATEVLPAIPLHRRHDRDRAARALLRQAWIRDGKLFLEMGL